MACFAGSVLAATLTVSNNSALPGSPGQYTTIQAAANAALAGDTILVHGSSLSYTETITITKKLNFRGPGFNPQSANNLTAKGMTFVFANSSSNSVIEGFYQVSITRSNNNPVSNLVIRKNYTNNINFYFASTSGSLMSNILIENNINVGITMLDNASSVEIRNNILKGTIYNSSSASNLIRNNLFVCSSSAFSDVTNTVISNNIFLEKAPNGPPNGAQGEFAASSTFNNNITFNCSSSYSVLPYGSNTGSGNLNNTDPVFTGFATPCTSGVPSDYFNNYRLGATSPARNAGTDGTDIGPTGGISPIFKYPAPYPITGEPAMPQVQSVTMPVSSVPAGGTLNVNVKARKRN
ncbi:MAG: hypothetical protein K0S44_481 [Bacteroidetes bacterium]|nr:hypothetical protein [Bacteroidota bacterium]